MNEEKSVTSNSSSRQKIRKCNKIFIIILHFKPSKKLRKLALFLARLMNKCVTFLKVSIHAILQNCTKYIM